VEDHLKSNLAVSYVGAVVILNATKRGPYENFYYKAMYRLVSPSCGLPKSSPQGGAGEICARVDLGKSWKEVGHAQMKTPLTAYTTETSTSPSVTSISNT